MSGRVARPELSIVIPAYNEARRLPESFARLHAYLDKKPFASEVIVVDDGSADTTSAVVKSWSARWPSLRLVQSAHVGKGGAVRAGVLAARGEWIALADADFSMPVEEFDRLRDEDAGPYDIAIASREGKGARRFGEPFYRHLMGRVFNSLVQLMALPGIEDSQCGFKLMRRDVALDLCLHQTIQGLGFDIELLSIARQRGYRIYEAPITWYYMAGSKVRPLRDTFTMTRDLFRVRYNIARGRYERRVVAIPAAHDLGAGPDAHDEPYDTNAPDDADETDVADIAAGGEGAISTAITTFELRDERGKRE